MGKSKINIIALTYTAFTLPCILCAKEEASARFHLDSPSDFISEKTSVFSINKRELDPFGRPLDPNKKVIKPTKRVEPKVTKKEQQILIEKEIGKLGKKITILGRNLIIDGVPYKRGSSITVEVKGKTFPLRVNSITRSKITFLDLTDKNIISLGLSNGKFDLPTDSDKRSLEDTADTTHSLDD